MHPVAEAFRLHQRMQFLRIGVEAVSFRIAGEDEIHVAQSFIGDRFGEPFDEPSKILMRRDAPDIQNQALVRRQTHGLSCRLPLARVRYWRNRASAASRITLIFSR